MKRALMCLAVVGMLCVAAGPAEAHGPGPMRPRPYYYHGGHPPVVMMRPSVVIVPRYRIAPPPPPPMCPPPCCVPEPAPGFYYRGRGFALGIEF